MNIDLTGACHLVPEDEREAHDLSGMCACHPSYKPHGRTLVVTHNAWDGREAFELDPFAQV